MTNKISDPNLKAMREKMDESDLEEFDKFIERNWSKAVPVNAIPMNETVPAKRRGRPAKA